MESIRLRIDSIIADNDMHIALTDDVDMLDKIRVRTVEQIEELVKDVIANIAEYEVSK